MLITSKVSMVVSSKFLKDVGFQNVPPFLSFLSAYSSSHRR